MVGFCVLAQGCHLPSPMETTAELSPAEFTGDAGSGALSADSLYRVENCIASEKSLLLCR